MSSAHRHFYPPAAYTLLVMYASLHPLTGWRDSGAPPFGFLDAGWPRYFTGFDLAVNLLAYLPFGLTWLIALRRHLPVILASGLACLSGVLLSLGMEALQTFLPSRVPSNLDLASNGFGAILGVVIGLRWRGVLDSSLWVAWRDRIFVSHARADLGLLLLLIWLLTQLSPETLLFGSGNFRQLLDDLPLAEPFTAERFMHIETVIAASGLLAPGLIASLLLRRPTHQRVLAMCLGFTALTLLMKTTAHALLVEPASALAWLTPGNSAGMALGLVLWRIALFTEPSLQRALAAMTLLFTAVMVNVAPENPYLENTLEVWDQGHFLNFNGLTRVLSSIWPFLALPWLMLYFPREEKE